MPAAAQTPSSRSQRGISPLIGIPLVLVGLPLALLFMPVWLPTAMAAHAWREHRFRKQMRRAGRFIEWPDLLPRLQRSEGTLIVEQAQKDAVRVWWTDENVARGAGTLQPPQESDLDYFRRGEPHPFVRWCHERFIAVVGGIAMLTHPPYKYPPGFVGASFFHERFPGLAVVITVKQQA
ncbi:MAG TPA: hypothetical protein VHD85_03000 [Terracidiphilus sp.]|nr:hypothetical protein [Terracidiphilus sp.]